MDPDRNLPSERNQMAKPQIFVHLEFGVSWSQRHTPHTHAVTYTSRNLRGSRDRGAFPRQIPPANTNYLAAPDYRQDRLQEQRQQAGRHHHYHQQQQQHHIQLQHQSQQLRGHDRSREHERPRQQPRQQTQEHMYQRRESRSESRGISHGRGHSAPPPFHDSPWDAAPGPSAALFPSGAQTSLEQPRIWKPLPAPPSSFRLGEDGLPWSAWAWPLDPHAPGQVEEDEDEPPFTNQPTTVSMSPVRHRIEDPERVRELESLSAAMMTVDNGFESQWWYQGPKEATNWWPRDQGEPSRPSMADALLLSAAEPPANAPPHGWYAPEIDEGGPFFERIVSPVSAISMSPSRPLQRSMTTRSEELFVGDPM
ncbi:hypothetical protein BJ170DRAFT_683771 [Xylariales sp. AK1849]|nr:hypothetical protein BJ170DRAFT_683771 [Xylariales sp. AK1849]